MSNTRPKFRRTMSWPMPILLAVRYLKSSRRDAYVSFLSSLAAGGITLGVGALVLVLSGLGGLQHFLRNDVLSRTPHLEIELPPETASAAVLAELQEVPGVVSARQIQRARGWLLVAGGAVEVEVIGVDGTLPRFFPDPRRATPLGVDGTGGPVAVDPELQPGEIFVGDDLAIRWGLSIGESLELVSAQPTLTPLGPQPRVQRVRVAGSFGTGRTETESPRVAVPLQTSGRLFGSRRAHLEVSAESLEAALPLAETLEPYLPEGARLASWKDLNRGLFFALELERMLLFVSVFLIVPVAAMALVTVLSLLISSKQEEIGMLQALGAERRDLRRAFLLLGALLTGFGSTLGLSLGIGSAWLLDHFRLVAPPSDVYFIEYIPFLISAQDISMVLAATALFALGSTWFAARRAAAIGPVETLRQ